MKLDSNLAWQDAQAAIRSNREVLLALAGVFFFVPTLALALLAPQVDVVEQLTPELLMKIYRATLPYMVPVILAQLVGSMAILTLFTDRTRPTVGGAIGHGAIDTGVFIVAMLAFSVVAGLAMSIVVGLAALTGVEAVAGLASLVSLGAFLYLMLRLVMAMPVIAVEGERNPLLALRRSWRLTQGNAGRILLVILLLAVVYFVISLALTAVGGLFGALLLGERGGVIAVSVLTAAAGAIYNLYVIAMLAMIHRQLSGGSPQAIGATFD